MNMVAMDSNKVKLYEMREDKIKLPYEVISQPIIYTKIVDVNYFEKKRKKFDIFPFTIKQKNIEKFIACVLDCSDYQIHIKNIETKNIQYNEKMMSMLNNHEWDAKIIQEMNDDDFEIESITFSYENIVYDISKYGVVSIDYPKSYLFSKLFEFDFIKKIIGVE